MKKAENKYADFFREAKKIMPGQNIKRAEEKATQILLNLRLAELRKDLGFTQSSLRGFTQSGVSKIEGREDLKISTLIEYCKALGMCLEIKAFSMDPAKKNKMKVLLRVE